MTMANSIEIIFPSPKWSELRSHLFGKARETPRESVDEQMALILAAPDMSQSSDRDRLIVREILPAQASDLARQSVTGIAPTGEFVAAALTHCRQEGWSLIEVHSHPFSAGFTTFSGIDWANDHVKMPALARVLPEHAIHATMVMGWTSLDAHYYDRDSGKISPIQRVTITGVSDGTPSIKYVTPTNAMEDGELPFRVSDRYTRQVLLFGSATQAILATSTLAIIGLGGLGSFAALECAHLGVGNLILIDPDSVETTNLNRLIGATADDVGKPKVEVYGSLIQAIAPETTVKTIPTSILSDEALDYAKQADVLLSCVDSHGARLVLNQLAVQYVIPLIDTGTGARLDPEGNVSHAGGQVQFVLPGLGCLECRGFIDARQAALDLAPPHVQQRERDHGYGIREPAPAVAFLNGIVASIQVGEAVKLLSNAAGDARQYAIAAITRYDLLAQSIMRATVEPAQTCPACGPGGIGALGDLSPIQAADAPTVPPPTLTAAVEANQAT